jgi:hypothetical protein
VTRAVVHHPIIRLPPDKRRSSDAL